MHLVGDAYKSIHKFLLTFGPLEDQLRGRMERVMAPDGDIEWVSVEGKDAWLKNTSSLSMTSSTSSPSCPHNTCGTSCFQSFHPSHLALC
jgi:hypothetical protein